MERSDGRLRRIIMRSVTDIFIKHPVLAVVVNLVIVLVGWRALTTLPVQQYPQIESSSVLITTIYYGASAETVRGFLTTPDRARRLGDQRRGLHRIHQPRRHQHRHGAAQTQSQQHRGARRDHRAFATGPRRVAGGSRAAHRRGAARRPAVRVLLPQFHLERTRRAGDHRLARAHATATALDAGWRLARDHRRGTPACDAHLD